MKRKNIREAVKQKAKESIEEKERLKEINKLREEETREEHRRRYLDEQK